MGKSVLVTGGAGFIGSTFVRKALEKYEDVYVLDKLGKGGNKKNIVEVMNDIEFFKGDIRDREMLDEIYPMVDHVVNFAAETHVDRSIESGRTFVQNNVEGAFAVMDAMRDHDIEQMVQMSTDEVYGSTRDGEFTEEDALGPSSPYSASKASADCMVNSMRKTYDLPISIARPTNAYGPRQFPEKLIPKFALLAMQGKSLPVYGDGSNIRQWIHVEDLSRAIIKILEKGGQRTYNVAGPEKLTNLEVTRKVLEEVGESEDLIEFVEDRKGHDYRYSIDGSKLKEETGFRPEISFEKGIRRTINWYRERKGRFDI